MRTMPSQNVLSDGFSLLYFKTILSHMDLIFALYSPIRSNENIRSFGFLYLYFTGTRRTGLETGGTPIWWMKYRIIHGLSYLIFSIMALMRVKQAYVVLLLDTLFGLALFLIHHYSEGDFRQLFHHS